MLLIFTRVVDFVAMTLTLWLAFYLLGKGFPSRIAMRAVIVLLALAVFFFGAFYNTFHQVAGTAAIRAICLIIALGFWYSLTYHLQPTESWKFSRYIRSGIYIFGAITATLLIARQDSFSREQGNALYVAHMGFSLPYVLYGIYQAGTILANIYNLLGNNGIGRKPQGRYFLYSTLISAAGIAYGVLALAFLDPAPRIFQDLFAFASVLLLGFSVAMHQNVLERRTTAREFVVSGASMLGISALYAWGAWLWGLEHEMVGLVAVVAVVSHSAYDLVREALERLRIREENGLRRQFHALEESPDLLQKRLQQGLDLLCNTLMSSAGFIAERKGDVFVVSATRNAMPIGREIPLNTLTCEDLFHPDSAHLPGIIWITPAFEGNTQVAAIGIGQPQNRIAYSVDDLDLFSEVGDRMGTLISLSNSHPILFTPPENLNHESGARLTMMDSNESELMAFMDSSPDPKHVKAVEEALRHYSDVILLGQSPLADQIRLEGQSHVERGKKLQQLLTDSIETLRPAGPRPREPLPRLWYNYVILHDAYVENIPNREIMARLYISEGTFNRTRRNALRGLSRLVLERTTPPPTS